MQKIKNFNTRNLGMEDLYSFVVWIGLITFEKNIAQRSKI